MTPFSSVAMLEKLALLKIAFCNAPVLSRAASRRTSEIAGSRYWVDISEPQLHDARHLECGETIRALPSGGAFAINHIWSLGQGRSLSRFQTARRQRAELGCPRALIGPETETFRVRFDPFGDKEQRECCVKDCLVWSSRVRSPSAPPPK